MDEDAPAIALDTDRNVYITGHVESNDFPATTSASDTSYNGGWDAFVSKFDSNLQILLASTYLGGVQGERGESLVIDTVSGYVYVAGQSHDDMRSTPSRPSLTNESVRHSQSENSDGTRVRTPPNPNRPPICYRLQC